MLNNNFSNLSNVRMTGLALFKFALFTVEQNTSICVLNLSENFKKKNQSVWYFIRTVTVNTKGFFKKIFFALSCWTRHKRLKTLKMTCKYSQEMSWVWQAISHFLHQISRPELPPLGDRRLMWMTDLVNNLGRSHTSVSCREPQPRSHILSATLGRSTRRTVLNPLLQRDPCEMRTRQCRRTHVSAHMHTSEQTNTCTQCHQGKLRPQFLLILPNSMPLSPQAFPTAGQHLPFFFPAAHQLHHPHPFLHSPGWTGTCASLAHCPAYVETREML